MKKNPAGIPHFIWHADDIRRTEREATDSSGLMLYELIQRAGEAVLQVTREAYPNARHWLVLCGHSNSGGDGYVMARLAEALGFGVALLAQESDKPLLGEVQQTHDAWSNVGDVVRTANISRPNNVDVVIDALSSTDSEHISRESLSVLIERADSRPALTMTTGIPSGLLAQTGATPGAVTSAAHIIIFIALKPGLLADGACDVTGRLHVNALGLDGWLAGQNTPTRCFDAQQLAYWLAPRRPTSHKDSHGRLVIVGGDRGTVSTIRMAGETALRAGAELVGVLMHSGNIASTLTARPELMIDTLTPQTLEESLVWAGIVMISPGLGQQGRGKKALQKAENFHKPMLWGAGALNLLTIDSSKHHSHAITPHPDETAQLLGCSIVEVKNDRLLYAQRLVKRYRGVVVLKDAGTAVAAEQAESGIIDTGSVRMASGRTRDMLSDIISALLGQKLTPYNITCTECIAHEATADVLAARFGIHGMLVTDLFTALRRIINPDVIDICHSGSSNSTT